MGGMPGIPGLPIPAMPPPTTPVYWPGASVRKLLRKLSHSLPESKVDIGQYDDDSTTHVKEGSLVRAK
jgi:hypothetical protein